MKTQKRAYFLLVIYLLILIWILLFKVTLSLSDLAHSLNLSRSINLIPFQASTIINGKIGLMEIVYNFLICVPFGGLLAIANKENSFLIKGLFIASFSLGIEIFQFILGVGASDITDLLMNTAGGMTGLLVYHLLRKAVPEKKLDKFLTILGGILLIVCLSFVVFLLIYNR
ncbi:VanZ family protein [Candidatus Enterococcus ferrettii]|uniref:VanZ-like domain-containing protein n=1 Tax=Candidatus Enterococcus ferrettii TaxID=2815324 RepID=A0ABV0EQS5_9ENTE|nr:VanZ family protein [Enterococcus sp. 665A]MBO1341129.1 VanZ family protein [Enterococcus sp. 665A]